jgi:VWFA-related protein
MKALNMIRAAVITIVLAALTIEAGTLSVHTELGHALMPPAQTTPKAKPDQNDHKMDKPAISVETSVVNLDVLVTDQDGLVLAGLKKENFRVLDDGEVQAITHFEPTSSPITIAVLMEYSGGANNYFAYKAAAFGSKFLNHLDPLDWVALVTYDIKPTVLVDFTRNKGQILQTLSSLSYPLFREANMYDAIIDTLERLDHVKGKKAILLLSTGADTFSAGTLDDTLKSIKQSDVTVFTVGIAESEYQRAEMRGYRPSVSYLHAKNQLQAFANLSGGMAWFPRFEGEMSDIFKGVAGFLRSQYSIGFSPQNLAHDGKYHKLQVEIIQPDGTPLMITTPKGKRQKPVVYARQGYTALGNKTTTKVEK